jgi:hypothetical protein
MFLLAAWRTLNAPLPHFQQASVESAALLSFDDWFAVLSTVKEAHCVSSCCVPTGFARNVNVVAVGAGVASIV